MPTKLKLKSNTKRQGSHHKRGKDYKQVYWPYLPLLGISFIILVVSFLPPTFKQGRTLAYSEGLSTSSLLAATNEERIANDRTPLQASTELSQAAQAKADDMVNRNYWSHQTPDGKEPWVFIDATGYKYLRAGENLAYGFKDSTTTVRGWMNSQSHRDNLLNSDFTEAGFGYASIANYQNNGPETVVVAMYGRPEVLGIPLSSSLNTDGAAQSQKVTKAQSLLGIPSVWAGIGIGILAGAAIAGLVVNHSLRIRRLIKRSEHYFVAHPLMDLSLVFLAVAAFNFSKVVGYIH